MRPILYVFGQPIPVYGLSILLGAAVAWLFICFLIQKKEKVTQNDAQTVVLLGMCGAIAGAVLLRPMMRLVGPLFNPGAFAEISQGFLFDFLFGEIVFYGGFLGGFFTVLVVCKCFKIAMIPMLDILTPALAIGYAIARIGCLFAGCCYGIEVTADHPLAIVYPPVAIGAPPGVPLMAVPVLASGFAFLLCAVLVTVYLKSNSPGRCAMIYLFAYSVWRFVIEFFRGDIIRGAYWLFTTSQYISVLVFALGLILLFHIRSKAKQGANNTSE